jgi:hypothetical protein
VIVAQREVGSMGRPKRAISSRLEQAQRWFEKWRDEIGGRGGRGTPIPPELWAEAVEVARVEGVGATVRALRLNAGQLRKRMAISQSVPESVAILRSGMGDDASREFVELDAHQLFSAGRNVMQFIGRDGERLRIDVADIKGVDLVEVALAFWSRGA